MNGPPSMPPTDYRASAELLARKNRRLIEAIKLAYRKHHLGDDSVGSTELSDELCAILADHMGDRAFQKWVNDVAP